jgi:uncharacterized membrane protein
MQTASLTPVLAIHLTAALAATALGPLALWARRGHAKGHAQRPRLHRAFGYAWVTMMLLTALSALWIPSAFPGNIAGFSWIHLFIPTVLLSLVLAFRALARGNIAAHRRQIQSLYISACLIAGAFTLMPGRYLGNLVRGWF